MLLKPIHVKKVVTIDHLNQFRFKFYVRNDKSWHLLVQSEEFNQCVIIILKRTFITCFRITLEHSSDIKYKRR